MFCSHCGVQNADDHNFCAACGAPLRAGGPAAGAAPPPYPQSPYGTMPPHRRTNVIGLAVFGLLMLAVGGAAAYVVLKGGLPGNLPLPGQAAMEPYSDPQGRFKIRYPRGWAVRQIEGATVFSQQAIPGGDFSPGRVTGPTIVAAYPEKSSKDLTADEALTETGMLDSHTQILGKRSGKVSTSSGEAEAEWVDFTATVQDASHPSKEFRGRVISEVRHRGDGTAVKGIAVCLSPPEAFASFDRLCSSAIDGYEVGSL